MDPFRSLLALDPPKGQEWSVFTYILNREIASLKSGDFKKADSNNKSGDISTTGKSEFDDLNGNSKIINPSGIEIDNCYGLFILLGTYSTESEADKRIEEIYKITKCNTLLKGKTLRFWELTREFKNVKPVKIISGNVSEASDQLQRLEDQQYENLVKQKEYQEKIKKERMFQLEKEKISDSVAAFKAKCILSLNARDQFERARIEYENSKKKYEKLTGDLLLHYNKNPSHEKEWLGLYENEIVRLGGTAADVVPMKNLYEKYRSELLKVPVENDDKSKK